MSTTAHACPAARVFGPFSKGSAPYDWSALHAMGPVIYVPEQEMYVVTGHKEICDITKDPATFSSAESIGFPMAPRVLVTADPPQHPTHRSLAMRAFSAARLKAREPLITEVVDRLIDDFIEQGHFDFIADFAGPLPVEIIADFIGVPNEDRTRFKEWSQELALPIGNSNIDPARLQLNKQRLRECDKYFLETIRAKRRQPGDDMISHMIARSDAGEQPLTDHEVLRILTQILIGGNETTTKMMGSAMEHLLANPPLMATVRGDLSLIPAVLTETLRIKPPMHGLFRTTNRETVVGGVSIPSGAKVMLMFSAGNHDERVFEDSDVFELSRPNARAHLAFSHGPHFCLGNALAQLEGRIAFERLLVRLDEIFLSPENVFDPIDSYVLQGLRSLKLQFTASTHDG